MARVESQNLLIAKRGLDKVCAVFREDPQWVFKKMAPMISTKEAYFRALQESDFSIAPAVSPLGYIPIEDFETPYFKDYTPVKRALIAQNSTESVQSDLYGIISKTGKKLINAAYKAHEVEGSAFLNLAFATDSASKGPDGVSLASAAHPYAGGVTTNIVGTNDALSISALEAASNALVAQLSHKGDPMSFVGPKILYVPPALKALAQRITGADKYPGTNYNDPNVVGREVEVVVNPWFTSSTAWMLRMKNDDEHGLRMITRRTPQIKVWEDESTDSVKTSVTTLLCRGILDWRGTMVSSGAGA